MGLLAVGVDLAREMAGGYRPSVEIDLSLRALPGYALLSLGRGLVALVNTFNPDRIVIGGGVAGMGSMLIDPALAEVRACAMPPARDGVRIARSVLGDRAGALGLAALLTERLGTAPAGYDQG